MIPRSIRLSEAPGFGKPIFVYDKHSIGAKRYQDLANEVLGLPVSAEEPQNAAELPETQRIQGGSYGQEESVGEGADSPNS